MNKHSVLNRDNVKLSLKKDRVAFLQSITYLLGKKSLSVEDALFCLELFLQNEFLQEAVIFLRQALQNFPKNEYLHKALLKILYGLNLLQEALEVADKLFALSQDMETFVLVGNIFEKLRDVKNALVFYEKAKDFDRFNLPVYTKVSEIYKKLGRADLSLKSIEDGVKKHPNEKEMLLLFANELFYYNRFLDAKLVYEKIIGIDDKFVSAYVNLGVVKKELGEYEDAHKAYEKALRLSPNEAGVYNNLGVLLKVEKKFYKAFKSLRKAIELNPNSADAHANIGTILKETDKPKWALESFRKALALNPSHINANFDYAITSLLLQDYKRGLFHYEHRVRMQEFLPKLVGLDSSKMYKKGTDIKGLKILVFAEQGFGDAIQFVRFIKILQERGAFVILRVREELKRLFSKNNIADKIILEGQNIDYDYHLPLLSILYLFDIDAKERNSAYLQKKKQDSKSKVRKIAFCFGGSPTHKGHKYRLIEPQNFEFLTKLENTKIYTIQMGEERERLKACSFYEDIIDKTKKIKDFYDTFLLLSEMDLVITSDTSVVHLSGAMGIESWLCLQKNPDWRWGREGAETFWYSSVKIFRQEQKGSWEKVFKNISNKLK